MGVLPPDLVEEILVGLPIKSLSRFKCVCKSWLDLISDRYFVKRQINHAKTSRDDHQLRTAIVCKYLSYKYSDSKYGIMAYDPCINDELSNPLCFRPLVFPPELIADEVSLTGYCDGVFCVRVSNLHAADSGKSRVSESIYLWNPCIHDFKKLPDLSTDYIIYDYSNGAAGGINEILECLNKDLYAIGYNPSVDDYYICKIPTSKFTLKSGVKLLYLKKSSWKTIGDQPWGYEINPWQCPASFNGNLYCLATRRTGGTTIVCYNGVEEKFQELALPEKNPKERLLRLETVFGGQNLCLITLSQSKGMQIWLYKGDGDDDSSWSCYQRFLLGHRVFLRPLCITRSCIYFAWTCETRTGRTNKRVVKYDFKEKVMRDTKWRPEENCVIKYEMVETLCSPTALIPSCTTNYQNPTENQTILSKLLYFFGF